MAVGTYILVTLTGRLRMGRGPRNIIGAKPNDAEVTLGLNLSAAARAN